MCAILFRRAYFCPLGSAMPNTGFAKSLNFIGADVDWVDSVDSIFGAHRVISFSDLEQEPGRPLPLWLPALDFRRVITECYSSSPPQEPPCR